MAKTSRSESGTMARDVDFIACEVFSLARWAPPGFLRHVVSGGRLEVTLGFESCTFIPPKSSSRRNFSSERLSFAVISGFLLLLRPESLQGLTCPASRPQPCIPVQSWKTLSIQRKLWSGCRPRLILQDEAWGVSKRARDTVLSAKTCFSPLPSKSSVHVPHLSNTCATKCGRTAFM